MAWRLKWLKQTSVNRSHHKANSLKDYLRTVFISSVCKHFIHLWLGTARNNGKQNIIRSGCIHSSIEIILFVQTCLFCNTWLGTCFSLSTWTIRALTRNFSYHSDLLFDQRITIWNRITWIKTRLNYWKSLCSSLLWVRGSINCPTNISFWHFPIILLVRACKIVD